MSPPLGPGPGQSPARRPLPDSRTSSSTCGPLDAREGMEGDDGSSAHRGRVRPLARRLRHVAIGHAGEVREATPVEMGTVDELPPLADSVAQTYAQRDEATRRARVRPATSPDDDPSPPAKLTLRAARRRSPTGRRRRPAAKDPGPSVAPASPRRSPTRCRTPPARNRPRPRPAVPPAEPPPSPSAPARAGAGAAAVAVPGVRREGGDEGHPGRADLGHRTPAAPRAGRAARHPRRGQRQGGDRRHRGHHRPPAVRRRPGQARQDRRPEASRVTRPSARVRSDAQRPDRPDPARPGREAEDQGHEAVQRRDRQAVGPSTRCRRCSASTASPTSTS